MSRRDLLRTVAGAALTLFALSALAVWGIRTFGRPSPGAAAGTAIPSSVKVVVYYFHGNVRCPTCRNMEAFSKEAVETGFLDAVKSGKLRWMAVNVETKGNEHFVRDFKLVTKSVIVAETGPSGRWTNLPKIWDFAHDKPAFLRYVQEGIRGFLKRGR
jgi:hypothetical protein